MPFSKKRTREIKGGASGQIPVREQYTTGDIAFLFGVSNITAARWMDEKLIPGFRLPGSTANARERRVLHRTLMKYVSENREFEYILDKLDGDLDEYEQTPSQKTQEMLNANARSVRPRGTKAKNRGRQADDDDFWS